MILIATMNVKFSEAAIVLELTPTLAAVSTVLICLSMIAFFLTIFFNKKSEI